ncbi:MAG: hypothetical protein LBR33_08820 [Propionibacteriaceae bacterium]|jgi:hypothetical protein|nr:hypothetical protein [Propionibacteriaceae bacterium]
MSQLAIAGHAWWRRFAYSRETGPAADYIEYAVPAGAAMVATLLGEAALPVTRPSRPRGERLRLEAHVVDGREGWFAGPHFGWTQGTALAPVPDAADLAGVVVYDEGLGGLDLPPDGVPVLWASNRALPDPAAVAAIQDRGLLMLDADVLRAAGVLISRAVSWERTATDLVWQLANNPLVSYLTGFRHVFVTFAEDGAVYVQRDGDQTIAWLALAHGGAEGSLRERAGLVPDAWSVMVAQAATQFVPVLAGDEGFAPTQVLQPAEIVARAGYDLATLASGRFAPWLDVDKDADHGSLHEVPVAEPSRGPDPDYWQITASWAGVPVFTTAFNYVKFGPEAIRGLPQFAVGDFRTADRREIEGLQALRRLFAAYVAGSRATPLRVAVTGPRGADTTHAVAELAAAVLPNVTVLRTGALAGVDPAAVFRRAADTALAGGLPVVFWETGPMAAGEPEWADLRVLAAFRTGEYFDHGEDNRPLGRGVLVLAAEGPLADGPGLGGVTPYLDATLDLLGLNPGEGDAHFCLRRAFALRALLERERPFAGPEAPIDDDLLRALLLVPEYKHGTRSLAALLDLSSVTGPQWTAADLPPDGQLDLHLDAAAFRRLLLHPAVVASYTDRLAAALADGEGEAWEESAAPIRAARRAEALQLVVSLRAIGCDCDAGDAPFPTVEELTHDEATLLAALAYDRRLTLAAAPDALPWDDLPEDRRQTERDAVAQRLALLHGVGLRVYRIT